MKFTGTAHKYGRDVDTDVIIPARYLNTSDPAELAKHCMEDLDAGFVDKVEAGDILVAEENFGCGSSREQAVYALQFNRVACVIAGSFPDIFFRNCLANGLTLVALSDRSGIEMGDEVEVDLAAGVIRNHTRGTTISFSIKEEDRRTFQAGGMTARVCAHLEEILAGQSAR